LPEDEVDLLLGCAELRLKAASQLKKTGFCDDAVSRAYYSMYFAATAMFLARGIRIKTHRGLGPGGRIRPGVRGDGAN